MSASPNPVQVDAAGLKDLIEGHLGHGMKLTAVPTLHDGYWRGLVRLNGQKLDAGAIAAAFAKAEEEVFQTTGLSVILTLCNDDSMD